MAHFLLLLVVAGAWLRCASADGALPLPLDPTIDCGPSVFYRFTKQNHACSVQFYHRRDPDAECCKGLALWYGPNSALPSRNCFCDKTYYAEVSMTSEKTNYQLDTAFRMCTAQGFTVPWYQEDANGTAIGLCAGEPANATASEHVCMTNCPYGTAATISDWASRLPNDPLVLASLVTGAISGVGIVLFLLPVAMDLAQDAAGLLKRVMANGK